MNDRIEKKISGVIKLNLILFIGIAICFIIYGLSSLIKSEFNGEAIVTCFINLIFIMPPLIYWGYFILQSVSEIIIEHNVITIKKLLRKPVTIQFKNISKIRTWGNKNSNRHFYIIEYDSKEFNLLLMSFVLGSTVEEFIDELQHRVDIAKSEINVLSTSKKI